MVLSMLPFDSTVKSNIAVGFILDFHYDGGCLRGSECTNSYQYIFPALFMVWPNTLLGPTVPASNHLGIVGGEIWSRNDFVSFQNQTLQNKILFSFYYKCCMTIAEQL